MDKIKTGDVTPDGNTHARWIANCICSNCRRDVGCWAIQAGYEECPNCHASMDAWE